MHVCTLSHVLLCWGLQKPSDLCNMSSNTASTDSIKAHTDIQGNASVPQLPAFEETDLEITDYVCVTIHHREDNSILLSKALLKLHMLQQLVPQIE